MKLGIAEIKVLQRKRKLDDSKIASLADSFAALGQLQPITVAKYDGMYKLVAGLHRLEAAKRIGWQTIEASIFEGDDIAAELAEIDENLMRNDLTVLEQGEHLLRRKELIGRRAGENQFTVLGGETVSPPKTTEEIAEAIGLTERSSQRRMQAAREITEDNIAAVNLYGAFTQSSTALRFLVDNVRGLPADASPEDDIKKAASQSFAEAGDVWE